MRLLTCEAFGEPPPQTGEGPHGAEPLVAALAHHQAGRWREAEACYRLFLSTGTGHPRAHYNLGLALQEMGRGEDALLCYERARTLAPDLAEAANNMGVVLYELGRRKEGAKCFEQALETSAYLAEAHSNLGVSLKTWGRPVDSIFHHQAAMRIDPGEARYRTTFIEGLSDLYLTRTSDALRQDLIETLAVSTINHQGLAFPIASIIRNDPAFQRLAEFVETDPGGCSFGDVLEAGLGELLQDSLLLDCLRKLIFRDRSIERVMTRLRAILLHMAVEADPAAGVPEERLPFVCALATQCFLNEYVYAVSNDEAAELREMRRVAASGVRQPNDGLATTLGISACYAPLRDLDLGVVPEELIRSGGADDFSRLVDQQVLEPTREKALAATIETIGEIEDDVSRRVRDQYEQNPYPRWLGSASTADGESLRRMMRRIFPEIPLSRIPSSHAPDILVAGCGTGQQVVDRALGIASSKVVGADLSLSSLSYGKRRAEELGISNATFVHADLLNLRRADRFFDVVECIGVLHHLDKPEDGLHALADILRPGGLMRIGLYSETARKNITATQSFIKEEGYDATPDGIRRCRQRLFSMPVESDLGSVTNIVDFYALSEVRDLLFHVRENRFDLLAISDIIDSLDLAFLGFELDSREKRKYLERFPDDPSAISLPNWHKYEQENTQAFIGLYLFWLYKPL